MKLRSPNCDCPGGCIMSVAESEVDISWSEVYWLNTEHDPIVDSALVTIDWDFFTVPDRIRCYLEGIGTPVYDTGCTAGSGTFGISVPSGNSWIQVDVTANCGDPPGADTAWSFSLTCETERCP
jgi:hypothetical protein